MKRITLMLMICLFYPMIGYGQNAGYPGRDTYPNIPIWETEDLNKQFENATIIDVRSQYEYDTLHINNAINIPLNDRHFIEKVAEAKQAAKPIVFYCNGHTCFKSYKAQLKADKGGISNTFAYDSGVFDWVQAHPAKTTLLGKTPVDTAKLIDKDKLNKHMLDPKSFNEQITNNTVILDIREASQRGLMELFPYRQKNINLDNKKALSKFLDDIKKSGKPLMVYDEAGKQVSWLQYYLDDKGINNYYFMKGGIKGYFKSLRGG